MESINWRNIILEALLVSDTDDIMEFCDTDDVTSFPDMTVINAVAKIYAALTEEEMSSVDFFPSPFQDDGGMYIKSKDKFCLYLYGRYPYSIMAVFQGEDGNKEMWTKPLDDETVNIVIDKMKSYKLSTTVKQSKQDNTLEDNNDVDMLTTQQLYRIDALISSYHKELINGKYNGMFIDYVTKHWNDKKFKL